MATGYNSDALVKALSDIVGTDDVHAKRIVWARSLGVGARAFNDFAAFEAPEVPMGKQMSAPAGIFCVKDDLRASGGDEVKFTVISDIAGPGVNGETELTGNTSTPQFRTWQCRVEWYRDAVEYTKKSVRHIAAGQDLWPISKMLLQKKLGRKQQHDMMMFLRTPARDIEAGSGPPATRYAYGYYGNALRPNYRQTRDGLYQTDTIDPSFVVLAKNKATELGAQPIRKKINAYGTNVFGYLFFGSSTAMTDIRNDSGYQNAIENAGGRGDDNPIFSGRLVQWQGVYWFEHHIVNPDWDDAIGSPLLPRFKVGVAIGAHDATAAVKASSTNTTSQYAGWFPGGESTWDYISHWYPDVTSVSDTNDYYAWGINPSDGSVAFFKYNGSDVGGKGVSGIDANGNYFAGVVFLDPDNGNQGDDQVGNLDATGDTGWGSNSGTYQRGVGGTGSGNTSGAYTYAADLEVGAICFPANANGAIIGHSFLFGANAAVRAYGSVQVNPIQQDRDYGFIQGHGFESVYGQAPCMRTDSVTNGYILCEHAVLPEGFDVPALAAP